MTGETSARAGGYAEGFGYYGNGNPTTNRGTAQTFNANDRFGELVVASGTDADMQDWFTLGDRDLATHMFRTQLLREAGLPEYQAEDPRDVALPFRSQRWSGQLPQRTHQPQRSALQKSFHVFPSNQRNVLAKTLPKLFEQPVPVPHLLNPHFFKHLRRRRVAFPQRIRKPNSPRS